MPITGVNRLLVDTNVLVYAVDVNSPFHNAAEAVLEQALQDGIQLAITPPNPPRVHGGKSAQFSRTRRSAVRRHRG